MMQSFSSSQLAISLIAAMGRLDFQEKLTQSLKEQLRIDAGLILLVRKGWPPTTSAMGCIVLTRSRRTASPRVRTTGTTTAIAG